MGVATATRSDEDAQQARTACVRPHASPGCQRIQEVSADLQPYTVCNLAAVSSASSGGGSL
eukprot:784032-Pleurochrysis_carterae.AAC.2